MALLLLTLLSACAHLDLEVTTGPAVPEKLGILLPDTSDPWDQGAAYHAEKTCSELQEAGELEYRLSVVSGANAMIEAAREMVSWGAQGIVVYPKWGGFEDAAQTLLKEGGCYHLVRSGGGLGISSCGAGPERGRPSVCRPSGRADPRKRFRIAVAKRKAG